MLPKPINPDQPWENTIQTQMGEYSTKYWASIPENCQGCQRGKFKQLLQTRGDHKEHDDKCNMDTGREKRTVGEN